MDEQSDESSVEDDVTSARRDKSEIRSLELRKETDLISKTS